ncbi:hypothetical protein HOC80_05310 [archaeon]|jgi:HTH-type transcriptional regulator, sugar sensing transcriptional regulator|nr:hypothetical protein [archaeon]MBT4417490.1 hypothetical protein [archaeon]
MNKQEFFESLGFSKYETKAIISLIKLKVANSKEISFDSGVPQNKLYEILRSFEKKGLLAKVPLDVKTYRLINLKTYVDKRLKEKEDNLKSLKSESKHINEQGDEGHFIFSLIRGQKTIMNKLAENNIKTEKEILGVQRSWKVWGKGIEAMKEAVKNGVKVKLIGEINESTKERAMEWKKIGCEIRGYNKKYGEFPLRFGIFDKKEARITIGKPEIEDRKNYITIWTKSQPLVNVLHEQFMAMWKNSKKF